MPIPLRRFLIVCFLALVWGGALAVSGSLSHPADLKAPLMLAGLCGLTLLYLPRLTLSRALVPFLAFWMFAYFRLSRNTVFQEAAVLQVGILLAFLLGFVRAPLAHKWLLPPLILVCVLRGLADLVTLSHVGMGPAQTLPDGFDAATAYTVTSFFADKHLYGGMLILGAFLHFYLMEKGDPHKPVQVLLYTSSLLVLLSILMVDSRMVLGVFFLCFLPLLFLSLKLDGREPRLERLAWITGITLCLGIAWINLPEMQMRKMASVLSPTSPGFLPWAWVSAWRTWISAPLLGCGIGGFRYAVVEHQGVWMASASDAGLPVLFHAQNHYLETLAEGGPVYLGLELFLILGAGWGLARIYYREWRLEAKYAFFSLAALALLGLFCPILELAPARIAYWALIGYGWSYLAAGLPARAFGASARGMAGGALAALTCLHLSLRIPELRSEREYVRAIALSEQSPKAYTNHLVEALRLNPGNEEANYGYVAVLAEFRREKDAAKLLEFIQERAPDAKRREETLARLYATLDRYDSSAKYSARVLQWYPNHLPAMEILMDAYSHLGRCQLADSLRAASLVLENEYPLPPPQEYTISGLDSLFRGNSEVLFLQRWFGGQSLRKKFVERRLYAYSQRFRNHECMLFLKETRCPADGKAQAKPTLRSRPRMLYRGWG
jgi:O-antigen ligase